MRRNNDSASASRRVTRLTKHYLKGRYYWNKRTHGELSRKGLSYFKLAIEKDPAYALAYSGLADCYGLRGLREGDLPPSEAFMKAKESAPDGTED